MEWKLFTLFLCKIFALPKFVPEKILLIQILGLNLRILKNLSND